jgi:hypothetical protein
MLFSTTGCKRVAEKVNFHMELHDELWYKEFSLFCCENIVWTCEL